MPIPPDVGITPGALYSIWNQTVRADYRIPETSRSQGVNVEFFPSALPKIEQLRLTCPAVSGQHVVLPTVNHAVVVDPEPPVHSEAQPGEAAWDGRVSQINSYYGSGSWAVQLRLSNDWVKWFSYPGTVTLRLSFDLQAVDASVKGSAPAFRIDVSRWLVNSAVAATSISGYARGWRGWVALAGTYAYQGVAPDVALVVDQASTWTGSDLTASLTFALDGFYSAQYADFSWLNPPVPLTNWYGRPLECEGYPLFSESSDSFEILSHSESS